ncbi:MAG: prepilin-type N-terminal cleavage/methylation domain-containing protein, partial [Alphaproteobacteria bacterium]|nr:prepilin-type N-terminal cleavage/methylation domain-containing protein [Alphaproteobacteria bacterium]
MGHLFLWGSHMMQKNRLDKRAGLTLVEATIVLAIVSVIIAAVWTVSSVVYENARQYQANRQMQTTVQNIRQLYARVNLLTNIAEVTCTLDAQAAFPV